jgi:hypothetical protein
VALATLVLAFVSRPADNVSADPPVLPPTPAPPIIIKRPLAQEPGGLSQQYGPASSTEEPPVEPLAQRTFTPVADACVLLGYPTTNIGSTIDMWVGYDVIGLDPPGEAARSLVQFDISSLPNGQRITKATLSVNLYYSQDYPDTRRWITAHKITGDWVESAVTWYSQPSIVWTEVSGVNVLHLDWNWYSFDVTSLAQAWYQDPSSNYGIMLYSRAAEQAQAGVRGFNTRESSEPPRLIITYEPTTLPPVLRSISPAGGMRCGELHNIVIEGDNFQEGMTARFIPSGQTGALTSLNRVIAPNDTWIGWINLDNLAPGVYHLEVENPDGQTDILYDAFTVWEPDEYVLNPTSGKRDTVVAWTLAAPDEWTRGKPKITKGAVTIVPTNLVAVNIRTMRGDFDLSGAAEGLWVVDVTTDYGQICTLPNPFVVYPPSDVTVDKITPNSGTNDGSVNVTIQGTGFQPGALAKLTKSSETIQCTNNAPPTSTRITCRLVLNGATPGKWNVVVTNPDSSSGSLPNGFTVLGRTYSYLPLVLVEYGSDYPTLVCGGTYKNEPKLEDWYTFTLGSSRTVTLQVTNYATKGQMQLRRNSPTGELIEMDGREGPTKTIGPRSLGAGTYFVRLYPGTGYDKSKTYTLTMTCN